MEKSETHGPTTSTAPSKAPKASAINDEPVPNEEDRTLTLKSLEIALVCAEPTEIRELKDQLVAKVMSFILEADKDELISAKGYFEKILSQTKLKWIKEADLEILHPTTNGHLKLCHFGKLRQPNGSWKPVAVKRAISSKNDNLIENEATILSRLDHKNIIKFYGKCEAKPEIVLEFMDPGSFLLVLQEIKFTTGNLLRILEDVACGMEYLSEKQYLHRNLTCANVFMDKKNQWKIGSFGLAVYVGDTNGVYIDKDCPIHYRDRDSETPDADISLSSGARSCFLGDLAPETIDTKAFSTATDVWSTGLLCWEIFQYASSFSNPVIVISVLRFQFFIDKIQLRRSDNCPDALYQYITKDLLNEKPDKRPTFTAIRAKIKEIGSSVSDQEKRSKD